MFDDLIKKKEWKVIFIDCNPIKISEKGMKVWGQQTLKLNKNKPVWDIKHHKQTKDTWYVPAGFIRKKI